jgi:hypothetical protein
MSYNTTTLLIYGFVVSSKEADKLIEHYGDDIETKGADECLLHLYGNMVLGDTAYVLGIDQSCHWGPKASREVERVNFRNNPEVHWVSKLFDVCYQSGVKTEGKTPDWLLVSSYE